MNLMEVKNDLAIKSKNGIGFLIAGMIVWTVITVIFFQPLGIREKNIYLFIATGLTFPLAIIISKVIKADWKNKDNPLSRLGLYLNLAQFMYFPIILWAFLTDPENMVLFFAIITGAHFFPYGWLYHAKPYFFTAPVISILMLFFGLAFAGESLWLLPFTMAVILLILNILLYIDYKKKVHVTAKEAENLSIDR
ncbi:hypothetical protein ACE1TI_18545 [Alteribacillus sp. JSM 102045]|uniref:DUF7010 family protein n=1 Tax=Alteribacillus sp. JSM 102045 TaxID=1562101 RepID=UPI0035C16B94